MASSGVDGRIIDILVTHCRVGPDGTLEWKERAFDALTAFAAAIGCDDMATATVRCRDLSAVSGQSVIGTLQRLFRDIGTDTGHEPNWQHVAVGAVRMIPHRAAAAPDFLHSIRSRRGDKAMCERSRCARAR